MARTSERLLQVGLLGSRLVDGLVGVGAVIIVVEGGGSPTLVAGVVAARLVPLALLGLVFTAAAHSRHRRAVLAASAAVRSGLGLLLAGLQHSGHLPVLALVLLSAAVGMAGAPYQPGAASLVVRVAEDGRLAAASAAFLATDQVAVLLTPAVSGALLLRSGPTTAFAVAAGLAALVALGTAGLPGGTAGAAPRRQRVLDGLRIVLSVRDARSLVLVRGAARTVLGVLLVVLALLPGRLGLPAADVGFLQAALALGGVLAALVLRRWAGEVRPAPAVAAGVVVLATSVGAVALEPRLAVLLAILVAVGAADLAVHLTCRLAISRTLPAGAGVAATGAAESLTAAGLLLGTVVAPLLVRAGSTAPATLAAAGVLVLALVALLPSLVGVSRRTEARRRSSLAALRGLGAVPVLRGLSGAAAERLAEQGERVLLRRGDLVVREGDPPDHVFVVLDGWLEVLVSGEDATRTGRLRVLRVGALFGEVGVLHRRPRTASIVAVTQGAVLRLPAGAFLEALGADAEAGQVVAAQADAALQRSHGAAPDGTAGLSPDPPSSFS